VRQVQSDSGPIEFALEFSGGRVLVYAAGGALVYRNARAERFLAAHELPPEVTGLVARILDAIERGTARQEFPGRIRFAREVAGRRWVFRVAFREAGPLVGVYFDDETVSTRFDLDAVRREYRLTRREVEIVRHLLDGATNQEAADELGIVEQTVKDHLGSVYRKIGVQDRFGLLRHLVSTEGPRGT
jgi:DNA-binding CsgD family transcriptional regulator